MFRWLEFFQFDPVQFPFSVTPLFSKSALNRDSPELTKAREDGKRFSFSSVLKRYGAVEEDLPLPLASS